MVPCNKGGTVRNSEVADPGKGQIVYMPRGEPTTRLQGALT